MSNDDGDHWFSGESSSNDADPVDRRLEAVPPESEWFDDAPEPEPVADQGAPATVSENRGRRTKVLFGGVVLATVAMIAAASWGVASVVSEADESETAQLAVPARAASGADDQAVSDAQEKCAASEEGSVVTGDGEGDVKSAAGVILAFQHAYYVERDADLVKPLLAKESEIQNLDALQKGIDSVEQGTTHCLRITSAKDGSADVELTQMAPDGSETVFYQRVTTAREGGETRLVSIADAPEKER